MLFRSDLLLGPESCAALLPAAQRTRLESATGLEDLVERIEAAGPKRVVVLASGDPLFYGTARYVCGKLGKDRFEVVPHVSSMQLAFARVKESWEDAFLANLAGQSIDRVIDRVRGSDTVGLFTSEQWPPAAVARALLGRHHVPREVQGGGTPVGGGFQGRELHGRDSNRLKHRDTACRVPARRIPKLFV